MTHEKALLVALRQLSKEDPSLHITAESDAGQLLISGRLGLYGLLLVGVGVHWKGEAIYNEVHVIQVGRGWCKICQNRLPLWFESPSLCLYFPTARATGLGELHLEVVVERLRREHGLQVQCGTVRVNYREMATKMAEINVDKEIDVPGRRGTTYAGEIREPQIPLRLHYILHIYVTTSSYMYGRGDIACGARRRWRC